MNTTINKFKKFNSVRTAIGFIIVGLLLFVIAGIGFIRPEGESVSVNAVITEINETGVNADNEKEYQVIVDYVAEGTRYIKELGSYDSRWKVGDVIECKYEVGHPENISYGNGKLVALVVMIAGLLAFLFGLYQLKASVKPSKDYAQYNRIEEEKIDPAKKAAVESSDESMQDYVFHYTGKMNQSHVMKDMVGREVFKAECEGITLLKDTDFDFINMLTGVKTHRKVSHTVTRTVGNGSVFSDVSSGFKFDGNDCWDFLAEMGYGFDFSLKGIKCHYEVKHYGVPVGFIETAGTEIMTDKYEGNPLSKLPTNGLYRISCKPSEVEGFFYICFCITRTEMTLT